MGEDDLVELVWKSGQVVQRSHTQRPSSDKPSHPPPPPPPPTILRGSGSGGGGGEENVSLQLPQPQPYMHHQNLFIQEDEMASWLYRSYSQDYFCSELLYNGVASTSATHPQSSVSLAPSPSAPYILPPERPIAHNLAVTRAENLMNFSWLRRNIYTSDRVEVGQSIPVQVGSSATTSSLVTFPQSLASLAQLPPSIQYILTAERPTGQVSTNFSRLRGNMFTGGRVEAGPSMEVGSSATPSSSAIESCVLPPTEGTESRVSGTFAVPGLDRKGKAVAIETARTPTSGVCKAETEPIQVQPATEMGVSKDKKRKEREETVAGIQGTEEARGSKSRKRSRAAEMHNLAERKRREKINERMNALQELIPGSRKSDRASMLEDVIQFVKKLHSQIQMISRGQDIMPPVTNAGNMQQFMPQMGMGMMGMNQPPFRPSPKPPHIADPPYPAPHHPFPNIQTSDPSTVHLPTPQPQFPAYMNPYSQFLGPHQMQQPPPPPSQSQTTSQLSVSKASTSKELEDQDNQPTG
ncbi:PREDICTED: transcription factor bHLH119-like [Camelina sativa]|uniref:Transcription factor bHLH119-like n=1 Tax=Camelina sativa TaxID=90675 RepID=A0ABM0UAP2_CAMSA|nr:PREDICTED: transcription factor bHLH119-like [Camelina sativa]